MYKADDLIKKLREGDRLALSKCITIVESALPEDKVLAEEILKNCNAGLVNSIRIGITGSPGAGKSSIIESIGEIMINEGKRIAILTIDPMNPISKGSILGDKTRMTKLAANKRAFIRSTSAGDKLGGASAKTWEIIKLCEYAGFESIIIETVGVGQSESDIARLVDMVLLVLYPGGGDELQSIKRGVKDLADLVCINKTDMYESHLIEKMKKEIQFGLHLKDQKMRNWTVPILLTSVFNKLGLDEVVRSIDKFLLISKSGHYFEKNREFQERFWHTYRFNESIMNYYLDLSRNSPKYESLIDLLTSNQLTQKEAVKIIVEYHKGF